MEAAYPWRVRDGVFRILRADGVVTLQLVTEPVCGASAALADEGFQAELTVVDAPTAIRPSQPSRVVVRLRNVGTHTWPSLGTDG
jgi:spermidine synthase